MKIDTSILDTIETEKNDQNRSLIDELRGDQVIVVLDDDPTGTQTVHDVDILTEWSEERLAEAFSSPIFYILTNSRSLEESEAYDLVFEICQNVKNVASKLDKSFLVIARGDSTLRGHYEAETQAIKNAIHLPDAITVFAPAFYQGGRFTIDNTHFVDDEGKLIPVSETPFAQDETFGFNSSNLYDYVLEKSASTKSNNEIFDLSIEELRNFETQSLADKIIKHQQKKALIINAVNKSDLERAVLALFMAQKKGASFIFRTAASIVSILGGVTQKPLLESEDFNKHSNGGLIVVGSYVPKTTEQLNFLLEQHTLKVFEVDVATILKEPSSQLINSLSEGISESIAQGVHCVLHTSRVLISGKDKKSSLSIVNQVSNVVMSVLNKIESKPSFVIAKGGITSSDVATKVLGIKKAKVLGQILPGVPVWELGEETKYPGMTYIVFPGNVGGASAVADAFSKLKN
ncbi:MAG: hypothetical protein JXR07_19155 [Reichenbachiella sp.]